MPFSTNARKYLQWSKNLKNLSDYNLATQCIEFCWDIRNECVESCLHEPVCSFECDEENIECQMACPCHANCPSGCEGNG